MITVGDLLLDLHVFCFPFETLGGEVRSDRGGRVSP